MTRIALLGRAAVIATALALSACASQSDYDQLRADVQKALATANDANGKATQALATANQALDAARGADAKATTASADAKAAKAAAESAAKSAADAQSASQKMEEMFRKTLRK